MPPDNAWSLIPWLDDPNALLLVLFLAVALLAGAYYALKRPTTTQHPPPWAGGLRYCARCAHRDGDQCEHPDSPVYGQACLPVCSGEQQCEVREFR
jgi:hypothetical protein